MRKPALPSDSLIIVAVESAPNGRRYHAVELAAAVTEADAITANSVHALCGWSGTPEYTHSARRGWGVGRAGLYSDQQWCPRCAPIAKRRIAELDRDRLNEISRLRLDKGSQQKPRPPKPGRSFASLFPSFAKHWVRCIDQPTIQPTDISASAQINVEWRCTTRGHRNYIDQPAHVQQFLKKRKSPCPFCRSGFRPEPWTKDKVVELIRSIAPHIATLSAADRYVLLLQTGILDSSGLWAAEVASAMLSGHKSPSVGSRLASIVANVDTFRFDLERCLRLIRTCIMSGNWKQEHERLHASSRASKRSLKGLRDMIEFFATLESRGWRVDAIRNADLSEDDIAFLRRRSPGDDDAVDELLSCLESAYPSTASVAPHPQREPISDPAEALGTWKPGSNDANPEDRVDEESALPNDTVSEILNASEQLTFADQDVEAIEYFVASQVAKLWRHAFEFPESTEAATREWSGTAFGSLVRETFLSEYRAVQELDLPDDWRFRLQPDGPIMRPRPMQILTAVRLARCRFGLGNWSLMGGGKTVSAVLASATIGSRLTVVLCPNATVDGWRAEVRRVFPEAAISCGWDLPEAARRRFIILNIEQLQLQDSSFKIDQLIAHECPDVVVLDEVHKFKQRDVKLTRRRENLLYLLAATAERNSAARVLAMTGTPVINNLFEARSLIELCTMEMHADLDVNPTLANAMKVHSRLSQIGLRYRPDLLKSFDGISKIKIDVSSRRQDLQGAKDRYNAEIILLEEKYDSIVDSVASKTLVYCELVDVAHDAIAERVKSHGLTVGVYNGNDKSGLEKFKNGQIDCLVASSAIATGVDGLQGCTSKLIIATLPWTASDFDQLLGRFFRPRTDGTIGHVDVIVPWTHIPDASSPDGEWSLDRARWQRARYKATLADTAVDGVLPKGELRSADDAFSDLQAWLARSIDSAANSTRRPRLVAGRPEDQSSRSGNRSFGEIATFHARLASSYSGTTHDDLATDASPWHWYHSELRGLAATWPFRPVDRCAEWILQRAHRRGVLSVADLGCGTAELAKLVGHACVVRSFDHVAESASVEVANVAIEVPLPSLSMDIVVLSLVLDWQIDWRGCLDEAIRVLALDGQLLVWETQSFVERIGGVAILEAALEGSGLTVIARADEKFVGRIAGKFAV